MSVDEYNTVRRLNLLENRNNPYYLALLRQYALIYCKGNVQTSLLKFAA